MCLVLTLLFSPEGPAGLAAERAWRRSVFPPDLFILDRARKEKRFFYEVESGRGSGRIRLRGGLLEPRELTDSGKVGRYAVFSRCPVKIASFPSHKIGTSPENGKNWGTNKQNGVDA